MFDFADMEISEPTGSMVRLRLSGGEEIRARLVREGDLVLARALPHDKFDAGTILTYIEHACTRYGSNIVGVPASVLRGLRSRNLVFKKQIDARPAL